MQWDTYKLGLHLGIIDNQSEWTEKSKKNRLLLVSYACTCVFLTVLFRLFSRTPPIPARGTREGSWSCEGTARVLAPDHASCWSCRKSPDVSKPQLPAVTPHRAGRAPRSPSDTVVRGLGAGGTREKGLCSTRDRGAPTSHPPECPGESHRV